LKGEQFDVAISDGHRRKPRKLSTPPRKPRYDLVIQGSGTSAKKVNELLAKIAQDRVRR
jgi:signal recognition particle GTPase